MPHYELKVCRTSIFFIKSQRMLYPRVQGVSKQLNAKAIMHDIWVAWSSVLVEALFSAICTCAYVYLASAHDASESVIGVPQL